MKRMIRNVVVFGALLSVPLANAQVVFDESQIPEISNSKLSDMSANTVKMRNNNANGDPLDTKISELPFEAIPTNGDVLLCENEFGELRKCLGSDLGGSGGGVTDGDKGDISVTSTGTVWTIDDDTVTLSKIHDTNETPQTGDFLVVGTNPDRIQYQSGLSVDISDDTNLSGDSEIVLTGDALSIASSIARDSELHDAASISQGSGINVTDFGNQTFAVALTSASQASLGLADTSIQPGDNNALLLNGAGYITSQTDDQNASEVATDTTNFGSNLSAADDTVQKALDTLDDLTPGGTVTSVAVSASDGLQVDSGSPITTAGTIALGVDATGMRTHLNVEDGATADQSQADIEALGFVTGSHTSPDGNGIYSGNGTLSAQFAPTDVQFEATGAGGIRFRNSGSTFGLDLIDSTQSRIYADGNIINLDTTGIDLVFNGTDTLELNGVAASNDNQFIGNLGGTPVWAQVDYSDLSNTPTIPSGNQIIDWTAASAGTIDPTNYVDNNTQLDQAGVEALGFVTGAHTVDTLRSQEEIEDFIDGLIVAGTNVTKTYDDAAGTLTISASGSGGGAQDANEVATNTASFNGLLSAADDDVQKALDTLDDTYHFVKYLGSGTLTLTGLAQELSLGTVDQSFGTGQITNTSGTDKTVEADGVYRLGASIATQSTGQRAQAVCRWNVNGSGVSSFKGGSYIRNAGAAADYWQIEIATEPYNLSADDVVSLACCESTGASLGCTASSATSTAYLASSRMWIEKVR